MAEFDTILITNPTEESFSHRFNGELYTIPGESSKHFPTYLSFHLAKHLSDKILSEELLKLKKANEKSAERNSFNPKNAQLMVYDNPSRRIALYKILGSRELVQECIERLPLKPFVGEMSIYDEFVAKSEKKTKVNSDE